MISVFEAVNMTRKERFVGTTTRAFNDVDRELRLAPPAGVRHWDFRGDKIVFNDLMQTYSGDDAEFFIKDYKRLTPLPGWKLLD